MKQRADNTCTEIENSLPLYVGGDLETLAAADVARHLETCVPCRASEAAARTARELLVSALELSQRRGPDLWPGIRAALADQGVLQTPVERAASVATASTTTRAPARRRLLSYCAAAAAAVLVGFWLGRDAFVTPGPYQPGGGIHGNSEPTLADNVVVPSPLITPVANPNGLRLVGRGESRLREGADIYYLDGPWLQPDLGQGGGFDPKIGAPVGLRQVRRQP